MSENADGSYQLYSEYILDATNYCDYDYVRSIDGEDIYQNNYKYSNIRAWLNGYNGTEYEISDYTNKGFYNMAFKDNEKASIITKEVDNSASTTDFSTNKYACENTFDKMYLLSYQDVNNSYCGFTRITDYAKAIGAYWYSPIEYLDYGHYWLRSPYNHDDNRACYANDDGTTYIDFVNNSYYGVRVACTINLE